MSDDTAGTDPESYDGVSYEVVNRVAYVRLDRPEVRNAQSLPLLRALDDAFTEAATDRNVKVVVLTGNGEAFSSGHDLGTPEQANALADYGRRRSLVESVVEYSFTHFLDYSLRWRDIPKPTIAQVHGWCMFGGWMLAAPMDLVIASDDARFMTGYLQFFSLPYDIGVRKAKEIMFMPREIGAAEAHDLGFVSEVVPRADLESRTTEIAEKIATLPLFYLHLAKRSANGVQDAAGFRSAVTSANAQQLFTYIDELEQTRAKLAGENPEDTTKLFTSKEERRPIVDMIMSDDADT